MKVGSEIHTTLEEEAKLLALLMEISGEPWSCDECECRITTETGWKPQTAFIVRQSVGVRRAVVRILCGVCGPAAWDKMSYFHDECEKP